jgi:tetratricopeptide (TPR) repeat protein
MTQRERLLVGLLGLVALGLRCLYVYQSDASPFFDFPQVDAKTYAQAATRMAVDGQWQGDPTPFWQPPLYPYFLGLVFALFGPDYYIARLVQAVLGAVNCVLIYFLGRQIFSSAVGLAAAGLAAIYGPLLFFDAELLPPTVAVLLDLLLLLSLPWALSGGYLRRLVPGLLFGLAALCVANILLFLPFALCWLLWQDGNLSYQQRLLRTLPLLLGAFLVIAPVSLRNYLVGDDWVLISSNAGINFFIGNNADYQKTVSIQPGPEWRKLVARPKSEAGIDRPAQKSRFFFAQAWKFIRTHPLDYGRLLLYKTYLFWHGHESGRNQDLYYARNFSSLLSLLLWKSSIAYPFGVLAPLALLGIGFLWRAGLQRKSGSVLLLLFLLSYALSVVLFFVTARYRLPVVPVLLLFAAYGARQCYYLAQERRMRSLIGFSIGGLALLAVSNFRVGSMDMEGDAEIHYRLGMVFQQQGLPANAVAAYRKALALDPTLQEPRFNLGSLYARQGRYQRAIAEYRKFIAHFPEHPEARFSLGNVLLKIQNYDAALAQYEQLLSEDVEVEVEVDKVDVQGLVAYTHVQLGQLEQATRAYGVLLQARPDSLDARYQLGRVYEARQMPAAAERQYAQILERDSTYTEACYRLALFALGRDESAAAKAHLQRLIAAAPTHIQGRWLLAAQYVIEHRGVEALEQLETILEIEPTHIQANWLAGHLTYMVMGDTLAGWAKVDVSTKYSIEERAQELGEILKQRFEDMVTK